MGMLGEGICEQVMEIYDNNREFSRETLHIVMHIGTVLTSGNHLQKTWEIICKEHGKSFAKNISYGTKHV